MTQSTENTCQISCKPFKGYTLKELRYRLMVNDLTLRLEKGHLVNEISHANQERHSRLPLWLRNFDTMIGYGQIAFFSYRTFKKIASLFRSSEKKR